MRKTARGTARSGEAKGRDDEEKSSTPGLTCGPGFDSRAGARPLAGGVRVSLSGREISLRLYKKQLSLRRAPPLGLYRLRTSAEPHRSKRASRLGRPPEKRSSRGGGAREIASGGRRRLVGRDDGRAPLQQHPPRGARRHEPRSV